MYSRDMTGINLTVEDVNRTLTVLREKVKKEKENASSSINSPGTAPINLRPIIGGLTRSDIHERIGLHTNRSGSR